MSGLLRRSARISTATPPRASESTTSIREGLSVKRKEISDAHKQDVKKARTKPGEEVAHSNGPEPPKTPTRRQRPGSLPAPPPITPTPSAVGIMAWSSQGNGKGRSKVAPGDRPAGPHQTNAHLISPETSRVVTYGDEANDSSPSKPKIPRPEKPTTTIGSILEEACAHLIRVDPRLKPVIEKHHCRMFSPEGLAEDIDPFMALTSGILAQQARLSCPAT